MKNLLAIVIITLLVIEVATAEEESRILRFPAIYENKIVFNYAGDLYTVDSNCGTARKLIGKRTWGAVVGIRGSFPLLDGGTLHKPEFSRYDVEGKKWIMEGYGVDPDIFVDNDPAKEFAGIDQQLNKAIEVILEELETQEKTIPDIPPYPVKTP